VTPSLDDELIPFVVMDAITVSPDDSGHGRPFGVLAERFAGSGVRSAPNRMVAAETSLLFSAMPTRIVPRRAECIVTA
jgi:hypothetical protein